MGTPPRQLARKEQNMIDAYTREELLRLIQEQQDMIAHLREDLKTALQAYRDALSRM